MSLQFVLGGSGSGKTRYIYEQLIEMSMNHPQSHFFAIVPEQFTMQTQKEIVSLHPDHGVMNLDIVSFQRLAYRIFEELAIENPDVLDDMGKSMVLRKVAAGKKKELVYFGNMLDKAGFIEQLKSMLSELYQYGISLQDLKHGIAALEEDPLLSQKLKDLAVIYQGFEEYINKRYITTEEILDVLCHVLPNSKLLEGSVVTLDGYTGFTPVQYRLLELMLTHCKKVIVTVAIDPRAAAYEESGVQDLFHMSSRIVCRLSHMAEDKGIRKERDIILRERPLYRFKDSEALDFLEQELLRYGGRRFEKEQDSISIFRAANPMTEVEYTVREISALVQLEGFRYREIAVITGDLGGYSDKLVQQFDRSGIPYFMDQKKSIIGNPMVEVVRSALEVIGEDFSYESVFRYLKTGLVTRNQEMICRMENYVIALGIRGFKRWNSEWTTVYRGAELINLEELNVFREEVLGPVTVFREVIRDRKSSVSEMTAAVVRLLTELRVEQQLLEDGVWFEEQGEYSLVKEYRQVYGLVMDLLDRLVGLLGDEVIGKREYTQILDAGFEEIKVGLIPATVDRIVIGDITRTRVDHVRALFFLGVNDGIVPITKDGGGVLLDTEREQLKKINLELAPTAREDGFMQRFYLYLMLTKPSRKLYLSFAGMSSDGKSLRPSFLIGTIQKMYPLLKMKESMPVDVLSVESGKQKLIQGLRSYEKVYDDRQFLELCRWFLESEEYRDQVQELAAAAFYSYEEQGIGQAAARALYGKILSGSVTRLEQYAACAYAHFLSYGLELVERREYELAAVDIGNLFHSSIDLFFRRMREQDRDWNTLTADDRKLLVGDCVQDVTAEYGNTILQSSARNAYLARKVERITDRTIWALAEHIKRGDFIPSDFEVSFSAVDNLEAMKITLTEEEQLHLRGRIDRMDIYEDEEHVYVKIIDYKSGGTAFDLAALYYGLQLQLVVYMDAVLELEERKNPDKEVLPAGIFYYNINDPVVDKKSGMRPEDVEQEILQQLRMNGLVNSDIEIVKHLDRTIETESDVIPVVLKADEIQESRSSVAGGERFEALREFVHGKLGTIGKEILDGEAGINPYKQGNRTACDYCPYHAVCGFDLKTTGYRFRRFKKLKTEEIWQEIEEKREETVYEGGDGGYGSEMDG